MTDPRSSAATADAIADNAMHEIWRDWFSFYERHFRAPNVRISMADQMAFYEIAQPIMRHLVSGVPAQPSAAQQPECGLPACIARAAALEETTRQCLHWKEAAKGDIPAQGLRYPRRGIYIASKTKHAARWLAMRDAGVPIISTWIDEAGEGQSANLDDLWARCLSEASTCAVLIVYREPDDALKGAWVEMGAALARGTPVFAVGLREYTIANYRGVRHFDTIEEAFGAWATALASPDVSTPESKP